MEQEKYTQLWLNYKNAEGNGGIQDVEIRGFSPENRVIKSAVCELKDGVSKKLAVAITQDITVLREGYCLEGSNDRVEIKASDEKGVLYGAFALIRALSCGRNAETLSEKASPSNPLRMMNHWDNMDGSIERGYSGNSFFFANDDMIIDDRTRDYARLMASIGINGIVINNVNVKGTATYLITDRFFDKVKELSDIFADYGISLYLSLNFASPIELGGLDSCDPLDESVISWWKDKIKEVYNRLPGFGGFLVKADSEGRPGPFTYGRTQADGANMLADIIKTYGGIIIWRCFVYNCTQDWRDRKTDRARAGYDYFKPQDGYYHDNVILQIKNGPMDFQIREPISPLLGGLTRTNQMLEVQIAQEYTGHQIDLCYLIPLFKEVLGFHTYSGEEKDTVADYVSGRTMGNALGGMAAVINTGNDMNWTGNDLAAANLYGFGRLAYDTDLTAEQIAREWIAQTFGLDREHEDILADMLLRSREIYEKYTCPLGIGWMVYPGTHYGPSIDGYEYSRWGTYHRADHLGIGVDRSDKGTGYAQQYYEKNAVMYNDPEKCPEELLLFFHHIPYTWKLKTGKSLIQHIYDSHFEGYEETEGLADAWKKLKDVIPEDAFERVSERFKLQLENAREWRDQVNSYFYRKSGIEDEKSRMIY
jgi:alpha-glucuronidase